MSRNPSAPRCVVSRLLALAMATRAPLPDARAAAAALAIFAVYVSAVYGEDVSCIGDGLHADYESDCQEYVKCVGGSSIGRYWCPAGRAFSSAAGACVSRRLQACVRRGCARGDSRAHAAPGSACRRYYRCQDGAARELSCPAGAWFDVRRQACTRGAGTCFEPLCVGLPDGDYPDASHDCRRTLRCRGGEVRAVTSCVAGAPCYDVCPSPRYSSIPVPAGDADFCSDDTCSSMCQDQDDGAYPDRSTGCREYFVCKSKRVISRGVCEPGLIFHNGGCVPADRAQCPSPGRSPCYNRPDGLHRDWRDCSSWFDCRRERVIARGSCGTGLVFDGKACVSSNFFYCEGPEVGAECDALPSGTYQDLKSNCSQYFHCEGKLKFTMKCEAGKMYDGGRCTPIELYTCPSVRGDSCYGRADGLYHAPDAGCRAYFSCFGGEKAMYACAAGTVFDGDACVPDKPGVCTVEDDTCKGLANGYHGEIESKCRRYFYCEGGDRLATLYCSGDKKFDGHSCVDNFACGDRTRYSVDSDEKDCERDGFFVQRGTQCKSYYFCVQGTKTSLNCSGDQVFNGQVCVPRSQYSCPD